MNNYLELNQQKKHLNRAQFKALLVDAIFSVFIWSRGTGKTEGVIAPSSLKCVDLMPRGTGVFVAETYLQLLDRTLPPILKVWEETYKLKRDVHFWVRKKPADKLKIPKPIYDPITPEHCIYFFNGAVVKLVSQDRAGTSNGMTVDWIKGDEAKLLDRTRFEEDLLPTNRGNNDLFGNLSQHHSILLTTDMPTSPKSAWLLEYESLMDTDLVNLILALQFDLDSIKNECAKTDNADKQMVLQKSILKIEQELVVLRKECVYYSEADIFENIEVLGEQHIRNMYRSMSTSKFNTSILNLKTFKIEDGFYPTFNEDLHCYSSVDYSYIDSLGPFLPEGIKDKDSWRKDKNTNPNLPLHIAMDYGKFSCLIAAQDNHVDLDIHSSFYSQPGEVTKDVVKEFCCYYKDFTHKVLYYYYDQTAVGIDGKIEESYKDQVVGVLKANGWLVNEVYLGQAVNHDAKYVLFNAVFKEDDSRYKAVRINRNNNKYLIISLDNAGAINGSKGISKDKRAEKKEGQDQRLTTHLSDAFDTLYIGTQRNRVATHNQSFGLMM